MGLRELSVQGKLCPSYRGGAHLRLRMALKRPGRGPGPARKREESSKAACAAGVRAGDRGTGGCPGGAWLSIFAQSTLSPQQAGVAGFLIAGPSWAPVGPTAGPGQESREALRGKFYCLRIKLSRSRPVPGMQQALHNPEWQACSCWRTSAS